MKITKHSIFNLSPYIGVFLGLYVLNNAFVAISIYHLLVLPVIILNKKSYKALFKVKNYWWLVLCLFTAVCGIIFYFIWDYIKIRGLDLTESLGHYGLFGLNRILFLVYFCTVHPLLEELYWRFNSKSDLFFAFYHFFVIRLFIEPLYAVICVIALYGIGKFWRYLKNNGNGLIVLLTHSIADFSIMYFIFLID